MTHSCVQMYHELVSLNDVVAGHLHREEEVCDVKAKHWKAHSALKFPRTRERREGGGVQRRATAKRGDEM